MLSFETYLAGYINKASYEDDENVVSEKMWRITKPRQRPNNTSSLYEPRQENLCLRAFRHDKF